MSELFAYLTPAARMQRYRELAAESFIMAERAEDEGLRAGYLNLATGWHTLALEIEQSLRRTRAA